MSSSALSTEGVLFQRGDGASTEVFTTVGEVFDVQGPDGEASEIDATDFESTAREFKMGLLDEGRVTVQLYRLPSDTQQAGLLSDRTAKTLRNFQIVLTDASTQTISFAAYVLGFSYSMSPDDTIKASVTLRISGAKTEA